MSKGLAVSLVLSPTACAPLLPAQGDLSVPPFSPEQLDNLLAPIALYPDPLLAQVPLAVVTLSAGLPIGVWLNHDIDWPRRRIYYHGWADGPAWIARSRPYIHINSVYVNDNLRKLAVNRSVTTLALNYGNLTRYNGVHQDVKYGSTGKTAGVSGAAVDDGRIDLNRGRAPRQRGPSSRPQATHAASGAGSSGGGRSHGGGGGRHR